MSPFGSMMTFKAFEGQDYLGLYIGHSICMSAADGSPRGGIDDSVLIPKGYVGIVANELSKYL